MVAPLLASMWSPHFCGFNVTCTYDRDRLAGLRNVTVSLGRPDFMLMNNEFGLGHPQSYHGPWSRYQKGAGRGREGNKALFSRHFLTAYNGSRPLCQDRLGTIVRAKLGAQKEASFCAGLAAIEFNMELHIAGFDVACM